MKLITPELLQRFEQVGDTFESENPLIIAKFFNPCGSGTWYATAYYPERNICYGYVTGLTEDEWGDFSIDELESLKLSFGLSIERDIHFKEKTFEEQFPKKSQKRESELKDIKSKSNQEQDIEHS